MPGLPRRPERAGFAPRGPPFLRQTRSRARGPTASGTRASPRGPRCGRGTRSTRRPRGASRRARLAAAARTRRHGRARARMRTRLSPARPTSAAAVAGSPCARARAATVLPRRRSRCRGRPSRRPSRRPAASWRYAFSSAGRPSRRAADDALQRLGERQLLGRAALEVELGELLGVERVPSGALEQRLLDVGRQHRAFEQGAPMSRAVCSSDSGARAIVVALSLPPPQLGPPREQLRPGRADDEQRDVGHPVDELVDEVEQAVVGPVEILEDEDRAAAARRAPRGSAARPRRPRFRRSPPSSDSSSSPAERARGDAARPSLRRPSPTIVLDGLMELLGRRRSASSASRMPAWAFTISPSAQNVTPSP